MTIQEYIKNINLQFKTGNATEHTYRGDLQSLLKDMGKKVTVTNEPSRIECGAPDYIITRGGIPIGYIEAKDIGANLADKKHKEQFNRYKASLDNLIITDYLTFELYRSGGFISKVTIGEVQGNKISAKPENFDAFADLIQGFYDAEFQTIKTSQKLAQMMASKARILTAIIEHAVADDIKNGVESDIRSQMQAFDQVLIKGIEPEEFADIYSQTITYGMFVARLHDTTDGDFSRQEAANLIPRSNPFLRKLFQHIAGYDLDKRIDWIIDALADVFKATDTTAILKEFDKLNQDPIIHFYEYFLGEYNPALRKKRGVYYTPSPVIKFIVNAVDDILKSDFGISNGLADTSKTKIKVSDSGKMVERSVHKVQILDPATGTGTFLAEVVSKIYESFAGQQGSWSDYVDNQLIPRLNGFEILMAPYAMAHLKLDLLLHSTGYVPTEEQKRLRVYLTNSLQEYHPDTGTLFANWLGQEANEANYIKRDTPVMVVIGNPPYSVNSSNKSEWIETLLEDYKQEPSGGKLKEKNPKSLNDDYVKFIRFGEHFVEKNGEGILAYINNHGFLDNPTFRGMRWHLLQSFDKIYIIDLHGNSKKKEACPNGSKDENVFDIQQGVSINIFIKTGKKKRDGLAQVYHHDLYGLRDEKYNFLLENTLDSIDFKESELQLPSFLFTQKNYDLQGIYQEGFSVNDLFTINSVGIVTARDSFTIHQTKDGVKQAIQKFLSLDIEEARQTFSLGVDTRDWKVRFAKADLIKSGPDFNNITPIQYRPFDTKYTYYTGRSRGFHCTPRNEIMKHFLLGDNFGLIAGRQAITDNWSHIQIANSIIDNRIHYSNKGYSKSFPLYTYTQDNKGLFGDELIRTPNLDMGIVNQISGKLGIRFVSEKQSGTDTFAPIDLLDYIYAVLHSPAYRETYKEFLKSDFPRVPYPDDAAKFWRLVELGGYLRSVHLLENPVVSKYITTYPIAGSNIVEKVEYRDGKVWINTAQHFGDVPQTAWEFYIGGYQPAQKWLKDRKGRTLTFEDISHYQQIIVALTETAKTMEQIDQV